MPLISVVMAVYNGEEFLEEAISGVLNQTFKGFEFIIVDDGSTDRTPEILSYITDDRVKIIHLNTNQGAANALNLGIKNAKGKWIAIHDADDVSYPNRLEEQVKFLREHKDVEAFGSLITCIPGKGSINKKRLLGEEKNNNRLVEWKELRNFRFFGNAICHGSMMFTKDLFNKVGKYNPVYKIAYDYDLWLRMYEHTKIQKVPLKLYQWRVNFKSLSRLDQTTTCNEVLMISTKYIRKFIFKDHETPIINIVGSKESCLNFKQNIVSGTGLEVKKCISNPSRDDLDRIFDEVIKGKVNGIITLYDQKNIEVFRYLKEKGLPLNEKLFHIWNVL